MKKIIILIACWLLLIQNLSSQFEVKPLHSPQMQYFPLSDVQLLDSDFKYIQDMTHKYLLTLEPDRLCSWFRREAGLTPKAQPYPGWESNEGFIIPGHILGFYLSSMSMMYETTGDSQILNRLSYILEELNTCQETFGDGYLSAVINGRQVFENVIEGTYNVDNGKIDDKGEPTYIMNKIMLGLYGVYTKCQLPLAKQILTKMADWFGEAVLEKLTDEEVQRLLICEHGSLSESFICTYELSGNKKHLTWAERLNDQRMLEPASKSKDILGGWHANCQIQKFTGFENVFRFTNDKKYTDAAQFFWKTVVSDHTWAMGGNSTGEHFFPKSEYDERVLRNGGPEACNSVNMLRLTEAIYQDFPKPEMIDYYERVLINHLLGAYEPETGMIAYMIKLQPGGFKTHSTPYNSFWCCTGTGLESPAKFQKMIYTHDQTSLFVNLFIPSEVQWKEKGVTIRQLTKIPEEEQTTLEIQLKNEKDFSLKIRHPYWVKKGEMSITINGEKQKLSSSPSEFVELKRLWKNNDKIVIQLPMQLNVNPLTSSNKFVSFSYGPVILAAELGINGVEKKDFWDKPDNWGYRTSVEQRIPLEDISWLAGSSSEILKNTRLISKSPLTFKTENVGIPYDYMLIPFYKIHFSRYIVYFPRGNASDITKLQQSKKSLEEKTIDWVNIGNDDSEKIHKIEAINSWVDNNLRSSSRRAANGGYFMYNLKSIPDKKLALNLVLDKNDSEDQIFDVLIDGKQVTTLDYNQIIQISSSPSKTTIIPIPESLTKGKTDITVKFHAKRKKSTAIIYDLRLILDDNKL
ncbi:glycoside hydrolase family 127 protein [Parabacteroides faecis]|uniref:beta-L-arabinofuranosidase domain-containing protein n=1 Tax=Parabacteroides TaxID=375288 RepID=UPI000EFE6B1C|nr:MULTISPECIES: beta-L-arabinofuranosidase domain-containing protein [Parabacteroides]MBC8620345.1 glycoside hydrolase family 127 protein [Parabacteroides faecis]RHR93834.1 hypothetical protein DWW23_20220 [Parabacteroides sp. AF14-59]